MVLPFIDGDSTLHPRTPVSSSAIGKVGLNDIR